MKYILEPLEGEKWLWDEKLKKIKYSYKEQGLIDVYMKHIDLFLTESASYHVQLIKMEKYTHKNTLMFLEELLKNYINLLKNIGFYPELYMHEICYESKEIFTRNLTAYEMYKLICTLEKLCKRYHLIIFGSSKEKIKLQNKEIELKKFKIKRCNSPKMFKYH